MDVDVTRHASTGQIYQQAAREHRGVLREVRIDALFPAVRAGSSQGEPLGRAEDPEWLEVGRLEEHLGRLVGDFAVGAAHDRGERDRLLTVGDQEIGRLESPQRPVERAQLLARASTPHDDAPAGKLRAVERMQGTAPDVHDVVRHVDDVRDRPHLGEEEARAQPLRRRADRDVAEDAADVARAATEVLDPDVDLLSVDDGGVVGLRRMELAAEERRDLARNADHREQVDPIHGRSDVEHVIADRKDVEERRARLCALGENHDPRVVVPEADLVLGEDHPARRLPAQLPLIQRLVEDRQERAGQSDRDGGAGLEVPRAADDLARVALPHVDLTHAQPVGVRVRLDREHTADEEASEVAIEVRNADIGHRIHLQRRRKKPLCDLSRRRAHRDVLAEPGEGRAHQNWPKSRGSLRQSSRRSGMPCLSTAMRSSPQPNANPV